MERAIIEDVDGEMVVTDLWNMAMPFIRYRNGDSVVHLKHECPCGRQLPLIRVRGRTNDMIITPKGPLAPTYLMFHGIKYNDASQFRSGIRAVQYVQKPGYRLEVYAVLNPWCNQNLLDAFLKDVKAITHGMQVSLHVVNDIPATPQGKRQFVRNEDTDLLDAWGKH
jgi:phenylacetate-CoA ligase